MKLYEQWSNLAKMQQTPQQQEAFWQEYFALEKENYKKILADPKVYEGTVEELAKFFGMENMVFSGFIDGINTSLKEEIDLDSLEETTEVRLDIDYEKLYFNMLDAKADWLYNLPEWDGILSAERRREITKEYRASKVFVKEKTVGRNDPCPCGSGKKYKKCCGKNA